MKTTFLSLCLFVVCESLVPKTNNMSAVSPLLRQAVIEYMKRFQTALKHWLCRKARRASAAPSPFRKSHPDQRGLNYTNKCPLLRSHTRVNRVALAGHSREQVGDTDFRISLVGEAGFRVGFRNG